MPGKVRDLRGHIFGRLTVHHYGGIRSGKAAWCCKCKCLVTCVDCEGQGCSVLVQGSRLIGGKSKSCGCSRTDPEAKRNAALRIPKSVRTSRAQAGAAAMAKCSRHPAYKLSWDRAAELTGLSKSHVATLCDTGILRSVWRGGFRRISAVDVADYMAREQSAQKVCPASDDKQ